MHRYAALALAVVVVFSGCVSTPTDKAPQTDEPEKKAGLVPVQERAKEAQYWIDGPWSHTLENGTYGIKQALSIVVPVEVPIGNGLPVQDVHMGLFLPDIPGCDYTAPAVAKECQVPIIADVGPYYGEPLLGDVHATQPANRLGKFLIDNFVPHGYGVAQVSVLGTGDSGGCMDLMGPVEQAGVQGAVKYLGEGGFSNGNVSLIGRSYDGSTPFEAAMAGSEHLKTIVPISGLYGQFDLMWKNGSAELRGPGVLWGLYYAFTYTGNDPVSTGGDPEAALLQARQIAENLICPDTQTGGAQAAATYPTGFDAGRPVNNYWSERSFKNEVLQNYDGSVYFIHGMQDWNVDPHMAFPFYNELEATGIDIKGMFGQWGHMYPDRVSEHSGNLRWDWAQDLLEWFDYYLKGTGPKPQLHVEMEDNRNQWRIEETWPPADLDVAKLNLADDFVFVAGDNVVREGSETLVLRGNDLASELRIAGLPYFHVSVTPQGPGGQLYVELRDVGGGQSIRLGHAIMDLRFYEGGQQMSQPIVPGSTITARMEFFPLDVVVPEGHHLELHISNTGQDYLQSAISTPVTVNIGAASVLGLPVITRDGSTFFDPPGWILGDA